MQSLGANKITVLLDDVELMNWIGPPLFCNSCVHDNSDLIRYIVNRGRYIAAWRYEISLLVLKNILLGLCAHS